MYCPYCNENRIQFRTRNNQTLIEKWKCLNCGKVFIVDKEGVRAK